MPVRLIHDNVIVAHEAYHYLKNKRTGNKDEVAIKMDMRKTYDRIEWDFLEVVLLSLGFCDFWVSRIMACAASVRYNLLLDDCC